MTKSNTQAQPDVYSDLDIELSKLTTTSAKIRYLNSLQWKRGPIAKKLDIRYQHVRNVLITPIKKI